MYDYWATRHHTGVSHTLLITIKRKYFRVDLGGKISIEYTRIENDIRETPRLLSGHPYDWVNFRGLLEESLKP